MKGIETPSAERKEPSGIQIGEIVYDEHLKGVLNQEVMTREIQSMNEVIESYLGANDRLTPYEFRIFGNRGAYETYLRKTFPDKFSEGPIDNAIFYHQRTGQKQFFIAKCIEAEQPDPEDPVVQAYLEKEGISFEQLQDRARRSLANNVYPSIAHEMTHLHPFFGGVGNESSGNKWEQEMVCVLMDYKMWEKYLDGLVDTIKHQAKEQAETKDFYQEIIKDFQEGDFEIEAWERLLYPYLEKRYGKERMVRFFSDLFKKKADFEPAFVSAFGDPLRDVMREFQEQMKAG